MGEIGMIMKYFYMLYKNTDLHNVLQYSFGFNGYIHNIQGLREMYIKGHVSAFKIGKRRKTSATSAGKGASHKIKFENAYFPSLVGKNPVKNTYNMKKPIIITGPNAAGKTTMIKTTIFNILCSQQTGFGFYDAAKFAPFDYIHCYINIPDTSGRDSLFQSEARRCKDIITIMKNAGKDASHFCVFDELYSGTNPYEAIASATAFLRYLNMYTNSSYMITTHFLDICNRMKNDKNVLNMKMKIDETSSGDFIYTYILENGISNIKGGIKVLRDLEYPEYIINETKKMIDTIVI
jgi:DNA mismatch repair ATPase MutS